MATKTSLSSVLPWRDRVRPAADYVEFLSHAQQFVRMNGKHQYDVEFAPGVWTRVPSVTQITGNLDKPALRYWAAGVQLDADVETAWGLFVNQQQIAGATREVFDGIFRGRAGAEKAFDKNQQKAKDVGTEVHGLIQHYWATQTGEDVPEPEASSDEALWIFAGFEQWAKSVALRPLATEKKLFSVSGNYAGTLDCLAITEGRLEVIDWKTSKKRVEKPYAEHSLQNVAYRVALEEMGLPSCGGRVVYIPKSKVDGFEIESFPIVADPVETMKAFHGLRAVHAWLKTG